ncbi:hypothetical protein FRC17_004771, partial [Serendipita sp. 399]
RLSRLQRMQLCSNNPYVDGGGIKGRSQLVILDQLMGTLSTHLGLSGEDLCPVDHFDMITGSGTGGLNAILLGRLRLTARQSLEVYDNLRDSVFEGNNQTNYSLRCYIWIICPLFGYILLGFTGKYLYLSLCDRLSGIFAILLLCLAVGCIFSQSLFLSPPSHLFDASKLEQCIKSTLDQYKIKEDTQLLDLSPQCFVFVTAKSAEDTTSGCTLLRNYRVGRADKITIWQAAMATMASLGLFRRFTIESDRWALRKSYVSGTLGDNNPTGETLAEVSRLQRAKRRIGQCSSDHVGCLISIGTGKFGVLSLRDRLSNLGRRVMNKTLYDITTRIVEDCEDVHRKQLGAWEDENNGVYVRLNVEDGLQGVREWEWSKKMECVIRSHTEAHHSRPDYNVQFDEVIKLLASRYYARSTITQ